VPAVSTMNPQKIVAVHGAGHRIRGRSSSARLPMVSTFLRRTSGWSVPVLGEPQPHVADEPLKR